MDSTLLQVMKNEKIYEENYLLNSEVLLQLPVEVNMLSIHDTLPYRMVTAASEPMNEMKN